MKNYAIATLSIASMVLPMCALRVTINGRVAGLSQFTSSIHQPMKLPVWPVWSGVIAQCFDWLKAPQISEAITSSIGGRVVPISLSNLDVSPFLLLAHHSHSFTPLDPVRAITKFLLPEGFPAHPHSGFDTVTYCIDGGLRHRDSEGIKMSYGNGDVQWMRAGRGVIHEEMWDLSEAEWAHRRIEIFQLWVNLPKSSKGLEPSLHLLKDRDIPNIDCGNGVSVKIICGSLFDVRNPSSSSTSSSSAIPKIFPLTKDSLSGTKVGVEGENAAHQDIEENQVETENELPGIRGPGSTISESSVSILHLNMAKGDTSVNFNIDSDCTTTVYVRRGSLKVQGTTTGTEGVLVESEIRSGDCVIYRMAPQMRRGGKGQEEGLGLGVLTLLSGPDGLDALVLSGRPLNEPVIFQGPLVLADEESYRRSAQTFNSISRAAYWDHTMTDTEWATHCETLDLQNLISSSNSKFE